MSTKKGISKSSKKSGDYQKGRELAVQPKAEIKAQDNAAAATVFKPVGGPPTFNYLNNVVNGAEIYQRTGRKIYMKSLHIKGYVVPVSGTPSGTLAFLRMIVFYDAQPNGAFPAIADLLKDSNAAAATAVTSEVNLDNRQRFTILREKLWVMGASTLTTNLGQAVLQDGSQCLVVNEFIKLKKIEAMYNATNGGTIADCTSGAVNIVFIADPNSTSGAWAVSYSSRLRYYD